MPSANPKNRPPLTLRAGFLWGLLLLLLPGIIGNGVAQTTGPDTPDVPSAAQAPTPELVRVQNLVRANVLGLAQEILETNGPAMDPATEPTTEWLQWERQLWTLYQVRGQWQKLYERTLELPPALPANLRREAQLLAIKALTALGRRGAARGLIRAQLPATDAPQRHKRRLRQALIATYLADDLLFEARIAMDHFRRDYGAGETDWLLLSAGVLLRSGDPDAAVNLLAPLDQPAARLLRIYARLGNRSLTPDQVIDRALALRASPRGESLERDIQAVMAEANITAGKFYPLADVLEDYLLAPPPRDPGLSGVYPQFDAADLLDAYARIARDEGNKAGLLSGEEWRWLAHARQTPPGATVARKALFAWLAVDAKSPAVRRNAVDAYVNVLIDLRRTALIAHLFGPETRIGELSLGGETGLRLSAHALDNGDFQLAAEANANLSANWMATAGVDRSAWLLQAGRIDIFAGRHRRGAAKLEEWIEAFDALDPAQTRAILQPIFDLQTVERHQLALALLHKVDARAPAGKYRREIAYWLAESYHGSGQYTAAADLFLHSALQHADGFDRWGEAARFRAAEALMDALLFDDARRLFDDLLARAQSDASRSALKQKLQRLWLLESSPQDSSLPAPSPTPSLQ